MSFVEATVVYRAHDVDPRDPAGERSEKRLINVDAVRLITPSADGSGRSIFHMREGAPPYFVVLEPPDYWAAVLTSDQPRPAAAFAWPI